MKIKKLPLDIVEIITLFLLFFAGMNFLNRYYIVCILGILIFILLKKKIVIDINVGVLSILSISWIIFSPDKTNFGLSFLIKPCIYPLAYIIGRSLGIKYSGAREIAVNDATSYSEYILPAWWILACGPFFHFLMNYINNIGATIRNTPDIWTGQVFSATGQAAMACMMISLIIPTLFLYKRRYIKLLAVACLFPIMSYNLILSGRTMLVLMAIIVLACTLYSLKNRELQQERLKIICAFVVVFLVFSISMSYNLFNLRHYLENSNLYLRFFSDTNEEIFSSGRLALKEAYFENLDKSFWGGGVVKSMSSRYAHDLFLDTYDEAGFFALFAVVIFVMRSFVIYMKTIKNNLLPINIRMYVLTIYISFYLLFFVEPILQGFPWLFMLFCVIHGMVEKIYSDMLGKLI